MYSKTTTIVGAVAFLALVNQVAAGPFIAIGLLAGIVGGSAAGAACSAGACKRAADSLLQEVELCSAALATASCTTKTNGNIVTISGVPAPCITLAGNYNGLAKDTNFSALASLGVTKVIDSSTIEIDLTTVY